MSFDADRTLPLRLLKRIQYGLCEISRCDGFEEYQCHLICMELVRLNVMSL